MGDVVFFDFAIHQHEAGNEQCGAGEHGGSVSKNCRSLNAALAAVQENADSEDEKDDYQSEHREKANPHPIQDILVNAVGAHEE